MSKRFVTQTGFTLIELLIGLTLASMVFIVATSVVVSTMNYGTKSKQSQTLEQTKNDLAADLSTNIRWATRITVGAAGNSFILNDGANTNEYKVSNNIITKGGSALTSSNVKITSFDVKKRATSLEININMENSQNPSIKDSLNLILSPRGKNVLEE